MKGLRNIVTLCVLALAFGGCTKELPEEDLVLSEDHKLWIPYAGVGFQSGKNFRDETGYVHQLNLLWDVDVLERSWGPGDITYAERDIECLCFGRSDNCKITMARKADGMEMDFAFAQNGFREIVIKETDMTTVDSVNLWGNIFYDVFVYENNTSVSWSGPCARFYMKKGVGIIGVEYRDGRYYVLQ